MKDFNIPPETMVVTSTYVTESHLPILEVNHEDDEEGGGRGQFHCGNGDYSMERMQLVRLDTILAIDPSISDACCLEMGCTAKRSGGDAPWVFTLSSPSSASPPPNPRG